MKNLIVYSTLLIAFSSCASFFNKEKAIIYFQQKIDKAGPENEGREPNYNVDTYWAASPFKIDSSDKIPTGVEQPTITKDADVFFIHPTTYINANGNTYELSGITKNPFRAIRVFQRSPWNADLNDDNVNSKTDILSITNQATAFNESCRIFAPRYRQANIKAFIAPKESLNAKRAFDLAYQDIKNAFQFYLDHYNGGRPIVIASHSQGTVLAERLLKDFFDDKPLLNKLVCAYLVGYPVSPGTFKTIPVGEYPSQTGCVVGWQSFNHDATFTDKELEGQSNTVSVNPISWTIDGEQKNGVWKNGGALVPDSFILAGNVSAQINYGLLMVKTPPDLHDWLKDSKNFHVWDYNLFWRDIRKNVAERIRAFNK